MVIGLGRFGGSVARELAGRGSEVLGIDSDPRIVQDYADDLTHTAVANTTDEDAMRQLGVADFQHAVVGIGTDLESSILTTSLLVDFQIRDIWAKAVSRRHGRILQRIGVHHVVLPEYEMGERVAHLVTGRMLDYLEFENDYALVKILAPAETVGRTLSDSGLRGRYGVTVVAIKRPDKDFTHAAPDTVIGRDDILIVAGTREAVEGFTDRV
ncbi:TrkA family potassium uptake protein [Actinophytocola sp.]|uniref:potassium channel family protein n=1 Tax=Actinophytocola sp. TaxID=1872138 RepID=UPI002D7EBA11|nr:TrkA family potassium uptake protein [Actinophytocola sp.]HET9139039.1 TrkA family potassium uptake protein [Actinophytocola sp.]